MLHGRNATAATGTVYQTKIALQCVKLAPRNKISNYGAIRQ
jgi:hypothetical protein